MGLHIHTTDRFSPLSYFEKFRDMRRRRNSVPKVA